MLPSPSPAWTSPAVTAEPAMPHIHLRVWLAVLVPASECPLRETLPFHSKAHLLVGREPDSHLNLTENPTKPCLWPVQREASDCLQVYSDTPSEPLCTPVTIHSYSSALYPTSYVVFCLLWLFFKTSFTSTHTLQINGQGQLGEVKIRRKKTPWVPLSCPASSRKRTICQELFNLPAPSATLTILSRLGNCCLCSCLGPWRLLSTALCGILFCEKGVHQGPGFCSVLFPILGNHASAWS